MLGGELGITAQEVVGRGGLTGRRPCDPDRSEDVGMVRRAVLEADVARAVEQDVDNRSLRGCQPNLVDEGFLLVASAVPANELHAGTREGDVEDAGIGGVDQVKADDVPHRGLT